MENNIEASIWQLIKNARIYNSKIISDLIDRYKPAVEYFIKSRGFSDIQAQDLAQQVFLAILQDDVLQNAEQTHARFRAIVIGATKHVILQELHKKDLRDQSTLDLSDLLSLENMNDNLFNQIWVQNLLTQALERLKQESAQKGQIYYQILSMNAGDELSYKGIARELGKTPAEIKDYVYRARDKLTRLVREEIVAYATSKDEFDDEVNQLFKHSV